MKLLKLHLSIYSETSFLLFGVNTNMVRSSWVAVHQTVQWKKSKTFYAVMGGYDARLKSTYKCKQLLYFPKNCVISWKCELDNKGHKNQQILALMTAVILYIYFFFQIDKKLINNILHKTKP